MSDPVVEARGVHKRIGGEHALRGVDLAVEPGEVFVLMGPNGAGKSVLLSCLAGGRSPSDGEVAVLGGSPTAAESPVSFMLQDAMGIDALTGRENVEFYAGLHPALGDRWREYADRLGLDGDLDKRFADYSGGTKRKLELTVCLAIDRPVYLLDEPTAGLDLSAIQTVHSLVHEFRDAGKTFVVASHLPEDAEMADRIAFLRDGEIGAVGSPSALLDRLPPVVELPAAATAADLSPYLRDGRLFEDRGAGRGFLREDADVDDLAAAVADAGVESDRDAAAAARVDATYTDMFNYYVHVEDGES